MVNGHFALAFDELATLLELRGASAARTRGYRAVADAIRGLDEPVALAVARGDVGKTLHVGAALASDVRELVETGALAELTRARAEVPASLRELIGIAGLGPGQIRRLWHELAITSVGDLVDACRNGRVAALRGFGASVATEILREAEAMLTRAGYVLLAQALAIAGAVMEVLVEAGAKRVRSVGPARRGVEVVHEVVIVASEIAPSEVIAALQAESEQLPMHIDAANGPNVTASPAHGGGPRVRVRCTSARGFVEASIVETGDEAHVSRLEARAKDAGLDLRAVFESAADEDDVYTALGLPPIPPELRDAGVVEIPPELLPVRGVRGVFHVHTRWSDGTATIADMARAALEAGFSYIGISDHSRAASYANGLDVARLLQQRDEVVQVRQEVPQITLLHGMEVDILEDGSLDLPDDILSRLDFVVASVHTGFKLSPAAQTRRLVRALAHPLVTLLGHPTGRLLLGRPGYTFDADVVARAAATSGACLEINASPQRLDLSSDMIRRAARVGARFCINPDAHEPRGFGDVPLGIAQARRAGLSSHQVLNSMSAAEIVPHLRSRRRAASVKLGLPTA